MRQNKRLKKNSLISRRGFLRTSGSMVAAAGGVLAGCGGAAPKAENPPNLSQAPEPEPVESPQPETGGPRIQQYRVFGRTGFEVSDLSMGGGVITESNVARYAFDRGVNYFDVAESYGNGDSERKIGQAMPHMDRDKIFVVTKLGIEKDTTEQSLLERFHKCLERLATSYVNALHLHAPANAEMIRHEGFHNAVKRLKADGKLQYVGISSHGPRGAGQDNMEKVLLAAAEDGRFDTMLLVYNFMKSEEGQRVLAACKERNIGTAAMKTYAGKLEVEAFDPKSPTEEQRYWLTAMTQQGMEEEAAIKYLAMRYEASRKDMEIYRAKVDAFVAEHGIKTQDELDAASIRWVLGNEDMHTICVAMPDFDSVDKTLPLSGTKLTAADERLLRHFASAYSGWYCRHGCTDCLSSCPHGVSVSTVMRYSYYYNRGGREKLAMQKYASLNGANGLPCLDCDGPCLRTCPHGVPIQASLLKAHGMLTLA